MIHILNPGSISPTRPHLTRDWQINSTSPDFSGDNHILPSYLWCMQKNIITTTQAPAPIGPYSQAVQAGNLLFISGQVPINPATGTVEAKDVAGETDQVMKNLNAVLTEAGYDFSHVVKTTIFLSDMSLFNAVNEVYGKYFSGNFPARETVAVKGLPRNVNVEISMIAAK
jgi:2-iminobutanoate/2-iminopropanoate deaminase